MQWLVPGLLIVFFEVRQTYHQVTTKNLQQSALSAAGQFKDLEFEASERMGHEIQKTA